MEIQNRIIVIDDDKITRESLKLILEEEGYETETAKTGHEGVEKIHKKLFNITLLDNKLPDIEGTELLLSLKEMHPDMDIIMITGNSELDSTIKALNRGASAYVLKPLDIDSLLRIIKGFVEKQCLIAEKRQTEKKLKESEEKYRFITENANDLIFILNQNMNLEYINVNVLKKLLGFSEKDMIGKSPIDFIFSEDIDLAMKSFRKGLKSGQGIVELRCLDKSGLYHWLEIKGKTFKDQDENTKGLFIARDITERKKREEVLEKTYSNLSQIFNIAIPLCVIDTKLNIIRINDTFSSIFNVKREELIGRKCYDIIPGQLCNTPECTMRQILDGKDHWNYEKEINLRDGTKIVCNMRAVPYQTPNGEIIGVTQNYTDITAQKEVELKLKISETKLKLLNKELEQKVELRTYELKHSEEKIRNLINNISDVLMECDIDGTITFVSPQIYDLIGYRPEELIGSEPLELIHLEEKIVYETQIKQNTKAGNKFFVELRLRHKKGYYVPISLKGSIEEINYELRVFVVIRNISEQRKIDEMIKHEIKKLKELDQIRSDLIRRISHELKTPLISIFNGSQYLLDHSNDKAKDQTQRIIQLIHQGGYRLKNLVNNLILTYNIESGELDLNLKRQNIIRIIKNCVEDIVFQAKRRDIFINIELPQEQYIKVDESMIKRAIFNIISNAVKNTPPNGNIFINTFEHPNYIEIIVKDEGVGLTKKERMFLFKRFGKIERHGKGMDVDIEGAGLGLYIANEIVKLHNGEIIVKSKGRNKGSAFTIRLLSNQKNTAL